MAAEAAVSFAVETLGKLLIDKAVFLKSVKGEVEWLRGELKGMQCFLKDAAKKESDSESIRNWISDVRKAAHDAEDAIEMFVLKVESKSLKKRYSFLPIHLYHLNKVGEEIKSIRQTLVDIQDRRVRYDIQKDEPSTRTKTQEEVETRRRLAYWQIDKHVVGLEKDVEQLLGKAVFEKSQGLSVAAILGMGGMGKSTLASKIYNHPEVVRRFSIRSWVVVSSEFTAEDIMKQILLQLGISADELKRLGSVDDNVGRQEVLKKEVHKRLTGKQYFIVLDDVWEASHWESLTTAFPDEDKGSRLLLTSRNRVITTENGYVHNMKPLNPNESWDLFMRKAFGGDIGIYGCPQELRKVGEEILKKCGGLPLAICMVGGLLAKKTRSESEWEKVLKEMRHHLSRSKDLKSITAILELSYQNLPPELKGCFLCLGFFKEDTIVKAKDLVHIWVAQGLVTQEVEMEEVRMEDVARDYLDELIGRNMVQAKETEYDRVRTCQIHDLLRDLSIRKAKEEIDFEVLREAREEHNSRQCVAHKPRHHAIYCKEISFAYSSNRNQHLRSLFIHLEGGRQHINDFGGPSSYWKSFELLRVLHLANNVIIHVLPKGIGLLTGLRYLKMIYDGMTSKLPRSWAKLKNLEVLDLRGSYGGRIKVDKVILKMERLRHLYASVESCEVSLGNKRNLQTLHFFRVKISSDIWKIRGMSGVSKLGINIGETSSNDLFACLSSLENLSHLTLRVFWGRANLEGLTSLHRVTRLELRGYSHSSPVLFARLPPNLSHLTLRMMWLPGHRMRLLEKLPNLLYLKLNFVEIRDGVMVIASGGFPSLKVLSLKNTIYDYKMEIGESAMPELDQFIIRKCRFLDVEDVPERIKSAIVVHPH